MSVTGEYTLRLICEKQHESLLVVADFSANSRMEAKLKAREAGWMLTKGNHAFCPTHAEERRASWR